MSLQDEAIDYLCDQHHASYARRSERHDREMAEIAKENQRCKNIEGLGQLKFEVPAGVANEWVHKEGKEVLHDKGWQKYMKRNHPEMFARNERNESMVGYSG